GLFMRLPRSGAGEFKGSPLREILEAIEGRATPVEAVIRTFECAKAQRGGAIAATVATAMGGWGVLESGKQSGAKSKTWVTGPRPRPAHAALDGETVAIGELFSNGLSWPGDSVGDADELAGCNCALRINY